MKKEKVQKEGFFRQLENEFRKNKSTFILFVNDKQLAHFSYIRYIENQIRTNFGLEGTPIRFIIREKGKEN